MKHQLRVYRDKTTAITIIRKTLALILTLVITISLFPLSVDAYVGALTKNAGTVTAGSRDGYYYLTNDYIGFYIRPDGSLTTVPSQKTLNDVKSIGATETHSFYKQTRGEVRRTDTAINPVSKSASVISAAGGENPKLKQTMRFSLSGYETTLTITYELVQLDEGAASGTKRGSIIEKDASDSGRTWGVLASATLNTQNPSELLLWVTRHNSFGRVAHSSQGSVRLCRYTVHPGGHDDETRVTFYSGSISSGLSREEAEDISEAFTDSFAYANQFVALDGYMRAKGWASDGAGGWVPSLIAGIRGHWENYGSAVTYHQYPYSQLVVEHQLQQYDDFQSQAQALWGFRNLFGIEESDNIPPDPATIPTNANCIGFVNDSGTIKVVAGENENSLKQTYGSKLMAVFRGEFKVDSGNLVFKNGAVQLSPAITATWTEGSGSLSVGEDGTVTAKGVHLSAPIFKFYKPSNSNDTSLRFGFSGGKLTIGMTPANNEAILHIDIPGVTCEVEEVTAGLDGSIVFKGTMSIYTPMIDAANITMKRLGLGFSGSNFSLIGVEASGEIDMEELIGLDVFNAKANINSFPGEERYEFEMELNIYDMFEANGKLKLVRINSGALVPDELGLEAKSEQGIPLVPPAVVAELNGLGGGFSGLAGTLNGDFFGLPPLRLNISGSGSVLEIIEGTLKLVVGAGYFETSLTDATIMDMDILEEFKWYMELQAEKRNYKGVNYTGSKVTGGLNLDLAIFKDMPFIKAGGGFNASAFSGLDDLSDPKKSYITLAADGKIYGIVQIPAEAWAFDTDLTIADATLDFALGGETTADISKEAYEKEISLKFKEISGYGAVAYTTRTLTIPWRIYYIFKERKVGFDVGWPFEELEPFDPNPYNLYKLPLFAANTGGQVGIMVMNDNLSLFAQSTVPGTTGSALSVSSTTGSGVRITQMDESKQNYTVVIDDAAPDTDYLVFSLEPDENWDGTMEDFLESLTVQKSGEPSELALVPAEFDDNGEIINNDAANVIIGENLITLLLPEKGTWTISSDAAAFGISCSYARPYASLSGMILAGATLTGTIENMDSEKDYILRTYISKEKGGTDCLLSQIDVPPDGAINETLSLTGSTVPTGSYYITTVLLEKVVGDFDGDEVDDSAYVTTDTFAFDDTVDYTNIEQPNPPTDVTLSAIGSELMRIRWKAPSAGITPDGYYIRLYQQNGGDWTKTGASYLVKASDLTPDAEGYYTLDMAVTAGTDEFCLEADNTFKAGITAFRYLGDADGDGTNDSLPIESAEAQSDGKYLPQATYPVLTYSPEPSSEPGKMKILNINCDTVIRITSDVEAEFEVTRMDTGDAIWTPPWMLESFEFLMPADFTGALNLKITAKDADGDVTVDYLGLRLDETAPIITLDSESFKADRRSGTFTVSGVTESLARVRVAEVITGSGTSGADIDANEVTAVENGAFTITGKLNPADSENELIAADSATVIISASDTAGNESQNVFAQIVRGDKTIEEEDDTSEGSPESSMVIYTDMTGGVSAESFKNAAQAAGKDGTVTVRTSENSVNVTGEGLKYLIDNNCNLSIITGSGTINISAGALAGLDITGTSQVEFVMKKPESFGDPELQALADAGHPIYEISILIDGRAVHGLAGKIDITLSNSAFAQLNDPRVIHVLGSGAYQEVAFTQEGGSISFTLQSLSYILVLDGETADGMLRNPFTDVKENNWFYDYVLYVYRAGLMQGTAPGSFSPHAAMTRAMAVTVLHRMSRDNGSYENIFSDVPSGAWYEEAAAWAAVKGIAGGVGSGRFDPGTEITREQLAVMLYRYAKYMDYDVSVGEDTNILSYNDAFDISEYAYAALQWACGAGIIKGDNKGSLNPQGHATRAEIAAMLKRFIEYSDRD
jgi:hypothetical protein